MWTFVGKVISHLFSMLSICCSLFPKDHVSFNFMAAVTVYGDFEAQENKTCHYFHFLPIYLP